MKKINLIIAIVVLIQMQSFAQTYLPLTGGTLTGALIGTSATFNGIIGIGGGSSANTGLLIQTATTLSGANQYGLISQPNFSSSATTTGTAAFLQLRTATSAFTMTNGYGAYIAAPSIGAGSAVTNVYGLYIDNQTGGATNNYGIYSNGGTNYFSGNVGIGTTLPDAKLTVAGKIHSQEIKVTTSAGADFVFNDDYKLRSLSETEAFIKENKHLPEIVPAETMKREGIELGELNIKLLQKIEELTLYMIELKKENEMQQIQLDQIIKKNKGRTRL